MNAIIANPVLRGFHPDPSFCRVGEDYYLATSTFEWFPGVQIHHSRDLVHWRLVARPLARLSQLDLRGIAPSGGIWAPALSWADGRFWLVTTIVRTANHDQENILVTAPTIAGPWSDPIRLNRLGFDPSLFHAQDGRKYLVQMALDPHRRQDFFKGIYLTEYDPVSERLIGPTRRIFHRCLGGTEGPHLFHREGWYYLIVAEGGTGWDHGVTMARSRDLWGPYGADPASPLCTSRGDPTLPLQKAGHGSLVEAGDGSWWMAHLCSRPIEVTGEAVPRRCILGRETALQRVVWTEDGWLRLHGGGTAPVQQLPAPDLPPHPFPAEPEIDDFEATTLASAWQTLRCPADSTWLSLTERPGHLRLRGRESLRSRFAVSLVARRLQSLQVTVETCLEVTPRSPWHLAGLTAFYADDNHLALLVSRGDDGRRRLVFFRRSNGAEAQLLEGDGLIIPEEGSIRLRLSLRGRWLTWAWAAADGPWQEVPIVSDASELSDDVACGGWGFTGTFVGVCALDLAGDGCYADFDWFRYREEEP
jgi:xylan 1,4-beta-xylosidase